MATSTKSNPGNFFEDFKPGEAAALLQLAVVVTTLTPSITSTHSTTS